MDLYWFGQVRACSDELIWVQTGFAKFSRREEIDYSGRKETSCIPICWMYYFFSAYNIKRAFSLFKILWSQVSTIDYCKYILYVCLLFKHIPSKPTKNKFETLLYFMFMHHIQNLCTNKHLHKGNLLIRHKYQAKNAQLSVLKILLRESNIGWVGHLHLVGGGGGIWTDTIQILYASSNHPEAKSKVPDWGIKSTLLQG